VRFVMGFALALVSALAFGLYVLPRRMSRLDAATYLAYMAVGFLVPASVLIAVLHGVAHERLPSVHVRGLVALSGLIWAAANLAYILGIDAAGVARATAVKNLTGLFGTLAGIVLLGELLHPASIAMTLAGSGAVALAAILLGRLSAPREMPEAPSVAAEKKDARPAPGWASGTLPAEDGLAVEAEPAPDARPGGRRVLGMGLGLVAAVGLGVYLVPGLVAMRAGLTAEMYVASFAFVAGAASLVGAVGWAWATRQRLRVPWHEAWPALVAGVLWLGGSASVTPATEMTGLAVAWPVSQLGFYLTLAYAVVRLREVDWQTGRRAVLVASALTLVGLVLLGVARQTG